MATALVFLQLQEGKITKASLAALNAAQQVIAKAGGGDIDALVLGPGARAAAESARQYGLRVVHHSEQPLFERYLAAPYADAVVQVAKSIDATHVVAAATSTGKDLCPRVAALLDAGQASDIIGVNDDGSLRRPMFAGDVLADVEVTTERKVITVRASGFAPAVVGSASGQLREFSSSFDATRYGSVVSYEISAGGRPELGDAEVVVSGGRALQSAENFEKYIFPLADALGAAVGASRAAVDSGYAPNDWQVGQTGKIVAPNLYIALGISGAIQHLAGMKDSKVIVAINKDGDAPIFEVADYGLVGDLFEIAPKLTEAVRAAKQG